MPLNLIKTYNSLLELDAFDEEERNASLMGIFKRDFVDSGNYFRQKKVLPTLSQGKNTLSIFFNHLITMEDRLHRERIYDRNRAVRLHWIKYHLEERQPEHLQVFSVKDKVADVSIYVQFYTGFFPKDNRQSVNNTDCLPGVPER